MKPLRNLLDSVKEKTEKNKFLHTTYDAIETFLFQPNHTTKSGTHIRDGMDLKRTMFHVVIAMQLCLIHGIINIGHQHYFAMGMYEGLLDGLGQKALYGFLQLLPIIIVVHIAGLATEFLFAAIKRHQVEEGFLVSGMLIPLIMPPDIPLWMVAFATIFAVIIAKEAFGGTGMNVLNVALTARVFVFFAYPTHISGDIVWVAYDYNFLHQIFAGFLHVGENNALADGWTGATPLALAATGGWAAVTEHYTVFNMIMGFIPGSVGEMNKIFVLVGAGLLIFTGIGSWRIMLSMIIGTLFMGIILNLLALNPFMEVPFYYHFIIGSFFFAMAFMATDPVTAAQTEVGKWIYGFSIGAIGMIIRVLNPAYPEGWMLAILFMNVFAPLIDHYVLQANIKRRLSRAV
ncbi:MAG: NADH:ubiquinone reductase (Na(+)-transporting) subunit B [Chitinophagaceae bacterium]|nr:MAG: NADH:ubiquinone reductase (Na(+)-transporting) subunit B [Chitinophagaceae bacterium]